MTILEDAILGLTNFILDLTYALSDIIDKETLIFSLLAINLNAKSFLTILINVTSKFLTRMRIVYSCSSNILTLLIDDATLELEEVSLDSLKLKTVANRLIILLNLPIVQVSMIFDNLSFSRGIFKNIIRAFGKEKLALFFKRVFKRS
jgi:hypothetical protein